MHRIRSIGLMTMLLAGLGLLGACHPTKEEYQAKEAEVAQLKAKLGESEQRANSLEARLKEMGDNNAALAERLNIAGTEKGTLERALEELRAREKQAQSRLAVFTEMLNKFKAMIDSGKLRVRVVRGRMVVELAENILFDSGRSDLKKEGQDALIQVASVLASIDNRDFQIAGHTDNIPIKSAKFPSNWELSTARAVVVTKFLSEKGVDPNRVSAAGYADTQPVAANTDAEGRKQNRRIEIVLQPNLDELPDLSSLSGK
ncbi:MAG: Flagellar motor rotation protein MotB [Myxococcaceae bacterium]|nr:Flagellar motor rotation protein MotB [Myxococcaceae bacterium]